METPTQQIEGDDGGNNKISCINQDDRALHRSLLACSTRIDEEDAIIHSQSLHPKRFTGWEAINEIFVTRDEPFLSNSSTRAPPRKREIKEREDPSSSSSDSDDTPETIQTQKPPLSATIITEKKEEVKKPPKLKRPSSNRAYNILPPSPTSPSPTSISPLSISPLSISPITFSHNIGSSGNLKLEEEKKDFLPKIEHRHSASRREDAKTKYISKTLPVEPPPNLRMYSTEALKPYLFEPISNTNNNNNNNNNNSNSNSSSNSNSNNSGNNSSRLPGSPKKVIDLPEPPARLRMYYSGSANSSNKKTVNIS